MKIMLPFGGDSIPKAALPQANRLANAMDGEVVLVAVAEAAKKASRGNPRGPAPKARSKGGHEALGGRVTQRLEASSDAVRGILHAAEAESPDIIVLLAGGFVSAAGRDERALARTSCP